MKNESITGWHKTGIGKDEAEKDKGDWGKSGIPIDFDSGNLEDLARQIRRVAHTTRAHKHQSIRLGSEGKQIRQAPFGEVFWSVLKTICWEKNRLLFGVVKESVRRRIGARVLGGARSEVCHSHRAIKM